MNEQDQKKHLQENTKDFFRVLKFVNDHSKYGFRRTHNPQTKRVIFEAISAGVHVALKRDSNLTCNQKKMEKILNSKKFVQQMHDPTKVKARVEFVANELLEK
jgi:hypothetical protein